MRSARILRVITVCVLVSLAVPTTVPAGAVKIPDTASVGPYAIGHTSIMLEDPPRPCDLRPRPIPVEVFYPVNPATITPTTPESIYPVDPINGVWPPTVSSDWEPPPPPETYVPIPADPRIKAIVPFDGSNQCMQFYELARVRVPVMGMGEEWTTLATAVGDPWTSWQERQRAALQGHPAYRIDVAGADHLSFSNLCRGVAVVFSKGIIDEATYEMWCGWVCAAPLPNSEAGRVTTKFMVAFLKTNLCQTQGHQDILTPGYVLKSELGLEFFVTEKRNPIAIDDKWPGYYVYFRHQPGSQQARGEMNPKAVMGIPHVGLRR